MMQKIEIGLDELGKRWYVYINGIPVGISFKEKRDASAVAKWLHRTGYSQVFDQGKSEAFSDVRRFLDEQNSFGPF